MATLHMLIGIPGSGKSTYAKNILMAKHKDAFYLASDKIRDNNPNVAENDIWPIIYDTLASYLKDGHDVIYDATNFNKKYRDIVKERLRERNVIDYDMKAYFFKTDVDVCINRVKKRNNVVGERYLPIDVIMSYQDRLEMPTKEEGFLEVHVIDNTKNKKKYEVK